MASYAFVKCIELVNNHLHFASTISPSGLVLSQPCSKETLRQWFETDAEVAVFWSALTSDEKVQVVALASQVLSRKANESMVVPSWGVPV